MSELFAILALLATAAGTAALVLGLFEAVKQISRKLVVAADDGALLSNEEGAATAGSSMTALRKTVIAFLAVLNKGWVPQKYLDALAVRLRRAGHPHELKPEETPKSNRSQISKVDSRAEQKPEPKKAEVRNDPPPPREEPKSRAPSRSPSRSSRPRSPMNMSARLMARPWWRWPLRVPTWWFWMAIWPPTAGCANSS